MCINLSQKSSLVLADLEGNRPVLEPEMNKKTAEYVNVQQNPGTFTFQSVNQRLLMQLE